MCACPSVSVNMAEEKPSKARTISFGSLKPRTLKNLILPRPYLMPKSRDSSKEHSESAATVQRPRLVMNLIQHTSLNPKRRLKIASCLNLRSNKSQDKLTQETSSKVPTPNSSFKIASSLNRGSTKESRNSFKQLPETQVGKRNMDIKGSAFQSLFRSRQSSKKDISIDHIASPSNRKVEINLNLKRSGSQPGTPPAAQIQKQERRKDSFEIDIVVPVPSRLLVSELDLPEEDVGIPPARINTIRTAIGDQSVSKAQSVSSKFTGTNRTGGEVSDSVVCNLSKGSSRLRGKVNASQVSPPKGEVPVGEGNPINQDLPKSAVM